jgi:hypothetical protein
MMRRWPHYELIGIGLQLFVLLPALLWLVRARAGNGARIDWQRLGRVVLLIFPFATAALSWRLSQGLTIPDESSYRHEARILASGRLVAPPPPGAAGRPTESPRPIRYTHEIVWSGGWFSKYPIGWPLVLAIPESLGVGWLVTPLLGTLLLFLIGRIAREAFGPEVAGVATILTALSPAFLAYCTGRLSHALAGVLVAGATLACLQGVRTGRISRFVWMFALLVCGFHVRPFTMLVVAEVLSGGSLWMLRKDRPVLLRVASLAFLAAAASILTVLAYNRVFTGQYLLSPYAMERGIGVPVEIQATPAMMIHNVSNRLRFSAQSIVLFSFPFLFPAAAGGLWFFRKRCWAAGLLTTLFCAIAVAYLVQTEASASLVGERYWMEAFFGVSILAAAWVVRATSAAQTERTALIVAGVGLAVAQLVLTGFAAIKLDVASEPSREMRRLAESFQHCRCVVYLCENPPFHGEHLNLNGPDWQNAEVFYAVDPGVALRDEWAARLGWLQWVALTYNPSAGRAEIESTGRRPVQAQ